MKPERLYSKAVLEVLKVNVALATMNFWSKRHLYIEDLVITLRQAFLKRFNII